MQQRTGLYREIYFPKFTAQLLHYLEKKRKVNHLQTIDNMFFRTKKFIKG